MSSYCLTPEQINRLADMLIDTQRNVYILVHSTFGVEVGDEIFDKLAECSGPIFKCDGCNTWCASHREDEAVPGMCTDCVD